MLRTRHLAIVFAASSPMLASILGCPARVRGSGPTVAAAPSSAALSAAPASASAPGASGCLTEIPEETLARLSVSPGGGLVGGRDLKPGDRVVFRVGTAYSYKPFEPLSACAAWTVAPTISATIDAATGSLVVADAAPPGALTVTAQLSGGRKLTANLTVVGAREAALLGSWREKGRLAKCADSTWITPSSPIGELVFKAGGRFAVTWVPFEARVDYWGTYIWDDATGKITLTMGGGNYQPADFGGEGTATLVGGELVLRSIWLGTAEGKRDGASCAHRFTK